MIEALLFVTALGVFLLLLVGVSKGGSDRRSDLGWLAYREERRDPQAGKTRNRKGRRNA